MIPAEIPLSAWYFAQHPLYLFYLFVMEDLAWPWKCHLRQDGYPSYFSYLVSMTYFLWFACKVKEIPNLFQYSISKNGKRHWLFSKRDCPLSYSPKC